MMASEWPLDHPERSTISWITFERSGVRWAVPATPTVVHAGGDQLRDADVRGREEMFPAVLVNADASSESWPWTVTFVVLLLVANDSNWTQAAVMRAPRGIATERKRMPTVCSVPSHTSSRSGLVRKMRWSSLCSSA